MPLVLSLHNFEVFAGYLSPDPVTRQYWIWAWQMSPLWIGVANVVGTHIIGFRLQTSRIAPPLLPLGVVCLISAGVWVSTILLSPYSMPEIFVPDLAKQADLLLHLRRAFQFDQVCLFGASFLWLAYLLLDMYSAGLAGFDAFWPVALLPVVMVCAGPGVTFAVGWYWRERILSS